MITDKDKITDIKKRKKILRRCNILARKKLNADHVNISSLKAETNFINNIFIDKNIVVAAYFPVNNEISPLPLIKKLNFMHVKTALPVVMAKEEPLIFKEWRYDQPLYDSDFYDLKEPKDNAITPNIIIVPLVAFDSQKNRLGYGGGFYDRTIKYYKEQNFKFETIGYGYSFQEVSLIPTEERDQTLSKIVTDEKVLC